MVRPWWVVACGACWSTTRPVTEPPPPDPTGTCAIRDRAVTTMSPVALSVDGQVFAKLQAGIVQLELTVQGEVAEHAAARVEIENVEIGRAHV